MAGNSRRRGAVRRSGTKKGPTVGSGGKNRRALEGRGPTPKASQRPGHRKSRPAAGGPAAGAGVRSSAGRASAPTPQGRANPKPPQSRPPRRRPADGATEVVAGRNPVVEALRARVPAKAFFVAARIDADDRVREALKLAAEQNLPLLEVTKTDLDRMTSGAVHQGVLLQVPAYQYAHPLDLVEAAQRSGSPALLVAMDGVTDPRNLGAAVRSVAAFGGHGVIVPERRSAGMTAAAWKVSAGAAARIPVARATNLTRALEDLRKAGCFIAGLDADGELDLPQLDAATEPIVLVVGSEGKGLSRLVRQTCDVVVSIPMVGRMESLNAGVAAGIALYEVTRRRSQG